MKQIQTILILVILLFSNNLQAQPIKDKYLSKKEILGVWQRDSNRVGNQLNQNFEFFKNRTFVLNLGDDRDDLRIISKIKGTYRMKDDSIFFTIISKTVANGKIGISDQGISQNIFSIETGQTSEIKDPHPKELADPCYITRITNRSIKLNNETCYKIQ